MTVLSALLFMLAFLAAAAVTGVLVLGLMVVVVAVYTLNQDVKDHNRANHH